MRHSPHHACDLEHPRATDIRTRFVRGKVGDVRLEISHQRPPESRVADHIRDDAPPQPVPDIYRRRGINNDFHAGAREWVPEYG
jgi:hypothetical protein